MVRRLGTLVGLKALAECLLREIAESRLMHDELKDFKKLTSVSGIQDGHYDALCKIITDKIADTDLATRTKEQVAAHDKHVNSLNSKPAREKGGKGKGVKVVRARLPLTQLVPKVARRTGTINQS